MQSDDLRDLLEKLKRGEMSLEQGVERLARLPYKNLGFASVDHHRALRQGVPEVIFGEGKTAAQILQIMQELEAQGQNALVTRLSAEQAHILQEQLPRLRYSELARTAVLEVKAPERIAARVVVLSAGTSDLAVAEEAIETLRLTGIEAVRMYDVGVAGIHRLLMRVDELREADVIIAIAGMEGALPSVVGGIVACPVIAVPTSVGYGSALAGFTPLMAMLTSCASGISVVNINNGFGAAMAAFRIVSLKRSR